MCNDFPIFSGRSSSIPAISEIRKNDIAPERMVQTRLCRFAGRECGRLTPTEQVAFFLLLRKKSHPETTLFSFHVYEGCCKCCTTPSGDAFWLIAIYPPIFESGTRRMASMRGFEPPTCRLGGGCSIQLSYIDVRMWHGGRQPHYYSINEAKKQAFFRKS